VYRQGSIIAIDHTSHRVAGGKDLITTVHTISIVQKVIGDQLFCHQSICSVNGGEWKHTKDIYPHYEGELAPSVRLALPQEFDVVIDTKLIPRGEIKNV